jgi:hypothetical protein
LKTILAGDGVAGAVVCDERSFFVCEG